MSNPRGKGWKCLDCNYENQAIVCKLTSIPPLTCGGMDCQTQSSTSYEWRITNTVIVGRKSRQQIQVDVPIYRQDGNNCGCYCVLANVQLMWRLFYAWNFDAYHTVQPDEVAFAALYNRRYSSTYAKDPQGNPIEEIEFAKALDLVVKFGIPLKWSRLRADGNPGRTMKIKSFMSVIHLGIEELTKLIANGFPLIGGVPMGRLQDLISCQEVYHAPALIPNKFTEGFHAFVLIGSGLGPKHVEGSEPVHETFFIARDYNGNSAHASTNKGKSNREEGVGGDFLVWGSDLCEVWKVEIVDEINYLPPNM